MGPKKKDDESKGWRVALEKAVLNDNYWNCKVVMFEPAGGDEDRLYLNKFENFAAYEKRYVIKSINKSEAMFMINQLGGEKKVKESVHHHPVFEEAGNYLREKKDIPPDVMALVIKHLILKMRDDYLFITRQKLQVKEGLKRESAIMVAREEVRGTVVPLVPEQDPNASPVTPKGKGKKAKDADINAPIELEEGKKYNTPLRLRGEEWRDRCYVDDFPIDGPKIYVAITGFLDPLLAGCLLTLGIPITAIIQINIDPLLENLPPSLTKVSKRLSSNLDVGAESFITFWQGLQHLRVARETASKFTNTAFIVFSPPYWTQDKLSGNPDIVYDEISFILYDVQDLTRQHAHFLDNMLVYNVPLYTPSFDPLPHYYAEYIDDFPPESVSILAIMDAMLQTISCGSRSMDDTTVTTENVAPSPDSSGEELGAKQKKAQGLVRDVFNSLCQSHDEVKHYRVTYGDEFELFENPKVLLFGDLAKYKIFHLNHINLDNVILNMLILMPVNLLWRHHDQVEAEYAAKISYHINLLLSCFDRADVETTELIRLIHLLACRKLYNNRSSLHHQQSAVTKTIAEFKNVFLKRSVLANPLPSNTSLSAINRKQNPYFTDSDKHLEMEIEEEEFEIKKINSLFKCPDLTELPSAAEIAKGMPIEHLMDNYEYFEDFTGHVGFQTLMEAFSNFSCVDYKYCEVTDHLLLMFYNSHDQDGISKEEWRAHIPTPVCLEDFFDYVLDEVYDWVRAEEELYDKKTGTETQSTANSSKIDSVPLKSCLSESDVADDLLMEGSLKYQDRLALDQTEDGSKTSVNQPSMSHVASYVKSAKKPAAASTPKTRSSKSENSESIVSISTKPFFGYDLGDRRIEAFGKDVKYFAFDGTKVTSKFFILIPENVDYHFLNVQTGNGKNAFWTVKIKVDPMTPIQESYCETLRITRKNNLTIFLNKTTFKEPQETIEEAEKSSISIDEEEKPPPVIITFYTLHMSWPTELVIETVYDKHSTAMAHVKQQYLKDSMNIQEDCRCFNLKGEIVVFKSNGHIVVMRPDSTYIIFTKVYKRPVEVEQPLPSPKVDKKKDKKPDKKGKKKEDEPPPSPKKEIEYELIFEDFEITSGDGHKDVYVSGLLGYSERLLIRTATDFCLGEVFSRRFDGTNTLLNKDGTLVVTFPDGTRIVSNFVVEDEYVFPEWTEDEILLFNIMDSNNTNNYSARGSSTQSEMSFMEEAEEEELRAKTPPEYVSIKMIYYMEHAHYATVVVNHVNDTVTIENPDRSSVTVDKENHYSIRLDDETQATFDGEIAHVDYDACRKCGFKSNFDLRVRFSDLESAIDIQNPWLYMKDSFKNISVNQDGDITIVEGTDSEEITATKCHRSSTESDSDTKASVESVDHKNCAEKYLMESMRFFTISRDLNCSVLLHRREVEEYENICKCEPLCSMDSYDTFGDHRRIRSVLRPIHKNIPEKWIMNSKLCNLPKRLTLKDLKKEEGKGWYEWMRPYKRFTPEPVETQPALPPLLPKAFILRTLELEWVEERREELKGGHELILAILKYRQLLQDDLQAVFHIPHMDNRSEEDRNKDVLMQALGHKLYNSMCHRLQEEVRNRAKADITTKPLPYTAVSEVFGEMTYDSFLEMNRRAMDNEAEEVEALESLSPNLKRYWRCRDQEYKEEEFHKWILREGLVPPYFQNILGGAIWWFLNHATEKALRRADGEEVSITNLGEEEAELEPENTIRHQSINKSS